VERLRTNLPLASSVVARTATFSALGIMTQLYLSELGASRFWVGMSTTLAWGAIMLFSRFWGTVSDVLLRRKSVILLAAAGSTLMTLILVIGRSIPAVLTARFLIEGFGAGLPPAVMAMLSERGGAGSRGQRMSVFTSSQAFGLLTGSVLGGLLSTVLPFRQGFLIMTGVSSVAVVSAWMVPSGARPTRSRSFHWRTIVRKTLPSLNGVRHAPGAAEHGLINLYVGVVLRKAGIVGIYGLLMVFLREARDMTPFISGSLSALNPAAQALAMPLWGRAADRLSRKRVFLAGYALSLLVPLLMLFSTSIYPLVAAFVVLGIGFAGFITGVTTFIGDIAPEDQEGELMGLIKVSQGLGGIVGPAIAGVISAPSVGGYGGMFAMMAFSMLVGLIITAVGTRESRPATSEERAGA
jgi:DHA1 family multidrug resistance protein-like MFS transporter